jgi:hypothetical protein
MSEAEEFTEELEQVAISEVGGYPTLPNLVWDYAHGILHSVCFSTLIFNHVILH